MKLTLEEVQFLTALAREQNQQGCRGPAHDLLRLHAYPDAPVKGPGSLAFAYEAVPLTGILLQDFADLQQIDDFVRKKETRPSPVWPWASADEYRARLEQARRAWSRHDQPVSTSNSDSGSATDVVETRTLAR
jgi:hypothetical protein